MIKPYKILLLYFLATTALIVLPVNIEKQFLLQSSTLFAIDTMAVPDSSAAAVIQLAKPDFPVSMKIEKQNIPVRILVKADGSFEVIYIPAGTSDYAEFLINALERSTFKPAYVKQQNVDSELIVTFEIGEEAKKENPFVKKKEKIDPTTLKAQIVSFIDASVQQNDNQYFQHFYYPMTAFYKGLIYQNHIVRKNRFIRLNSIKNANLDYQNDMPLYQFEEISSDSLRSSYSKESYQLAKNALTTLSHQLYPYSPMLVSTKMGMSEREISYADVQLDKNHLFNYDNLNFNAAFAASKGQVPLITESTANSRINVNYRFKDWTADAGINTINMDYSSKRLNNDYFAIVTEDLITEKSSNQWFNVSFKSLYMGVHNENQKMSLSTGKKIKIDQDSWLFGFKTQKPFFHNEADIFVQLDDNQMTCQLDSLFNVNSNKHLIGIKHNLRFKYFHLNNDLIYEFKDSEQVLNSRFDIPVLNTLYTGASYSMNAMNSFLYHSLFMNNQLEKQYGVHIGVNKSYIISEIGAGKRHYHQTIKKYQAVEIKEDFLYFNMMNSFHLPYENYTLRMSHLLDYQNTEKLFYTSQLLNKLCISIERDLKRNNKISLGVDSYYADDIISENGVWGYSFVIDTFVRINITKMFDLTVKMHNITNNEHYLGEELNPAMVSGTIRWNFLN